MVKIKFLLKLILIPLLMTSCINNPKEEIIPELIECPLDIRKTALKYAEKYETAETEYEWGGQDLLRTIKIDCSGLVVRCYEYALKDNVLYKLPFEDATAKDMADKYSIKTKNPQPGDLVFMGNEKSDEISHIGIFVKKDENENIYFIDSTQKDDDKDGVYEINGVSKRSYRSDNKKIKGYGIMTCTYR